MQYITKIRDCDIYLIHFLSLYDITNLCSVNKSFNTLIKNTKIYQSISQIINVKISHRLSTCYINGLVNILQKYYEHNDEFIIDNGTLKY